RRHVPERDVSEWVGPDARRDAYFVAEPRQHRRDSAPRATRLEGGAVSADFGAGLGEVLYEVHLIDGRVADHQELCHANVLLTAVGTLGTGARRTVAVCDCRADPL